MTKAFAAAFLLIAALVLAMSWSQDEIIFPTHAVSAAGPLPPHAERLQVRTSGDETLHGVHIPPIGSGSSPRTLVLGFGGNAWNAQEVALYLHELYPETHAVAFHYRGYRPSTGSPSAEALLQDAPVVFDAAAERVKPERTVAVGFSIGSGVAASLPRSRELDGLILVTPFDSLKKVASGLYPWLPVGAFFRHELDTATYLEGLHVPVAIVAGERDEIIPPARTQALRSGVGDLIFDRTIPGAGHNDIYGRSDFQQAMREAMAALR